MLESAGFDGTVHTAFFGGSFFPPPASCAMVFPWLHGAGAGSTADAGVATIIKRVVRHIVCTDVVPHLVLSPIGQGVNLDDAAMVMVEFDLANVRAGGPLIATQPCHPGI